MPKLTPKQERFAREYVANGGNATQAAIKAGYSQKTSGEMGAENLKKPYVAEFIKSLKEPIEKELGITAEWIRERLKDEATLKGKGATHSGRIRALELLGKDTGMFEEKESEGGEHTWIIETENVNVGITHTGKAE